MTRFGINFNSFYMDSSSSSEEMTPDTVVSHLNPGRFACILSGQTHPITRITIMPGQKFNFDAESVRVGRLSKSLPEQVAGQLLTAIEEGALQPGERLKEEIFAERFAVSRSTIREAIALLERRGVVERVPRFGARVMVIDTDELEELFTIRAQLLGLAARLAAEKGSDELMSSLRQNAEKLRELADDPATTPAGYAILSIETQRLLVASNGGKRLRSIYEELSNQALWRFAIREKSISFKTPQRRKDSAADWDRLVTAVIRRDPEAAERHGKALLFASYQYVKEQL
jgi:DNA-binding GntR family transcriptional regulator